MSPGIFIQKPAIHGGSGIRDKPKQLPSVRDGKDSRGAFRMVLSDGTGRNSWHLSLEQNLNKTGLTEQSVA